MGSSPILHGKQKEKRWKHWQISSSQPLKPLWMVPCSHEIRGCLLLGRNAMTNINNALRSRNIILPNKLVDFGLFIWILKLSVQSPLGFEVSQLSGPSRFLRLFCAFLYPVLKSAVSLRNHASSDGKCIQNLHVRPQNSHCYQVVIACRLSLVRVGSTHFLKK